MKRRLFLVPALLAGLLLAGCDDNEWANKPGVAAAALPAFPADIAVCLKQSGVKLPDRVLTIGEVERWWKTDRLTIVVMRNCGARVVNWYSGLRARYR